MADAPFDLDRYLQRVGLDAAPPATLEGLIAVQAAQLRAVPFENLDVVVHGRVDVEPAAVFEKLVTRGRGGYCFECNGLLREALVAIGFDAHTRLGRVVTDRGDEPAPARTHAVVEVRLGADRYLVDCGFGSSTLRGPLPIRHDVTRDDDARPGTWRLRRDPEFGWRLSRLDPGLPPRDLYVFDETKVYAADVAVGNHWTSSHPSSHFTWRPIAVRHTDTGRIVLNGRRLIVHVGDDASEDKISDAETLRAAIRERLGIPLELTNEQLDRLWRAAGAEGPRLD